MAFAAKHTRNVADDCAFIGTGRPFIDWLSIWVISDLVSNHDFCLELETPHVRAARPCLDDRTTFIGLAGHSALPHQRSDH